MTCIRHFFGVQDEFCWCKDEGSQNPEAVRIEDIYEREQIDNSLCCSDGRVCNGWVHAACEHILPAELDEIEDDYVCTRCKEIESDDENGVRIDEIDVGTDYDTDMDSD